MTAADHTLFAPDLFKDQVIVVTGGGRGIGRATAQLFARLGGKVIIAELNDEGQQVAAEINEQGGAALFIQTDIASEEQVNHLAAQTRQTYGEIDILINNAIYCPIATVLEMDTATWDRVMAVNLRGAFLTCRTFLPGMLARGQGKVINMVSTDAMPGLSAYIASKQGITGFSQSLQAELNGLGIKVVAFAPGMVDTPAIRQIAPRLSPLLGMEESQFLNLSLHPAYHGLMPPEDAASATALLAARYMDEFAGELVDGYAILERAGWIQPGIPQPAEGLARGNNEPIKANLHSAAALNQEFVDILLATQAEFGQLPVFARPMANAGFKRKAGLRLPDWIAQARQVSDLLSKDELSTAERNTIRAYHRRLTDLMAYYQGVPAETARFTRDEQMLQQVRDLTCKRLELIEILKSALS